MWPDSNTSTGIGVTTGSERVPGLDCDRKSVHWLAQRVITKFGMSEFDPY